MKLQWSTMSMTNLCEQKRVHGTQLQVCLFFATFFGSENQESFASETSMVSTACRVTVAVKTQSRCNCPEAPQSRTWWFLNTTLFHSIPTLCRTEPCQCCSTVHYELLGPLYWVIAPKWFWYGLKSTFPNPFVLSTKQFDQRLAPWILWGLKVENRIIGFPVEVARDAL